MVGCVGAGGGKGGVQHGIIMNMEAREYILEIKITLEKNKQQYKKKMKKEMQIAINIPM